MFKNLKENPTQSIKGVDKDGNAYTISVEEVGSLALTDGVNNLLSLTSDSTPRSWKVSYTGAVVNCSFYMTVTSNTVTSGYDKWIMTIACTYSNVSFTSNSQYVKLGFDVTTIKDLIQTTCWLKGTVTGSNNDINISWSM